jgi:predicted nuclease of predicted toxin-antitoxin system
MVLLRKLSKIRISSAGLRRKSPQSFHRAMGKIRIYTNESVDVAIADGLRRRGVEAFSARDRGNLGFTDEEQLAFAGNEKAAIFTHDTDFLKIGANCMEQRKSHHGIIYCHQKT